MDEIQHKNMKLEFKVDPVQRKIYGYASTFNEVDNVGDIILAGAYIESLKARMPKMLYQHDEDDLVGVWDVAYEDAKGLYVEGRIAKTSLGDEVLELASMGALDSMSIGYCPIECEYDTTGVRTIRKIDLYEVSFVTFPANPNAKIAGVKSLAGIPFAELHNHKDKIEAALRDAGASNRAVKYIASLIKPSALRDAEDSEMKNSAAEKFADFLNSLK